VAACLPAIRDAVPASYVPAPLTACLSLPLSQGTEETVLVSNQNIDSFVIVGEDGKLSAPSRRRRRRALQLPARTAWWR
jgi:hypothetical protein